MLGGGGGHRLDSEPVGFPPGDPRGDRKAWSFSVLGRGRKLWDSADLSAWPSTGLGSVNAKAS